MYWAKSFLTFCISILFLYGVFTIDPNSHFHSLKKSQELSNNFLNSAHNLPTSLWSIRPNLFLNQISLQDTNKCIYKLLNMLNQFMTDPSVNIFLLNSAKGLNDLGDIENCKNSENSYYMLLALSIDGNVGVKLGFCMPNQCPIEVVSEARPAIAKILSGIVGMEIKEENVLTIDMSKTNAKMSEVVPMTIIGFVILYVTIAIIIISSILDYWGVFKTSETIWKQVLICFVAQRNIKSLLGSDNKFDNKLEVLNGIRVIAICWVVLGHAFSIGPIEGFFNITDLLTDASQTFTLAIVRAGVLSVDVFFFLAGFLATLGFYKAFKDPKNRTIKNVLLAYFHRYMRLLPIVAFTYIYFTYFIVRTYDSPVFFVFEQMMSDCKDQAIWTFLYINNFMTKFGKECIGWVWYLFNDMQFYWVLPFFVWAYCKNKMIGLLSIVGAIFASFAIQFWMCIYYEITLSTIKSNKVDSGSIYYVKPYCRIIPYLMGTLLFFIYEEAKDPEHGVPFYLKIKSLIQNNNAIRYCTYFIGWGLMHLSVYSFYWMDKNPNDWGLAFGTVHLLLVRPVFILGLSCILYPVFVGKGKLLLAIFGHYAWSPLAKLTFGTYMLHIPILAIVAASMLQGKYYTICERFERAFLLAFLGYIASFIVTLLFESRTVMLLKNFLEGRKPQLQVKKPMEIETNATKSGE